jgi:hypothetical protein
VLVQCSCGRGNETGLKGISERGVRWHEIKDVARTDDGRIVVGILPYMFIRLSFDSPGAELLEDIWPKISPRSGSLCIIVEKLTVSMHVTHEQRHSGICPERKSLHPRLPLE